MFVILSRKYFGFNILAVVLVLAYFYKSNKISLQDIKNSQQLVIETSQQIKEAAVNLPYQELIEDTAKHLQMDEELIASIVFVESSFRKNAKSSVGAQGLMQIMPIVAREYNVKNAFNPQDNLKAGAAHFKNWMRVIEAETYEDQIKMTLAAYNAGLGHLRDAQRLAIKLDLNPHRWDHVKKAFLLLEQKKYYKKAKFGYCQGREVNKYVKKVYSTYLAYKHSVFNA
ncbi:MAG TPA: transglycosylase SLT domain-containing protein [Oligoflexia bacterium]|nr:transglycosylase SLT domain-containing protein [Oligoflexia bacterium]HMR23906.1 transglycosylase SLT domain-containing protein [Oligoflexia bacterium]